MGFIECHVSAFSFLHPNLFVYITHRRSRLSRYNSGLAYDSVVLLIVWAAGLLTATRSFTQALVRLLHLSLVCRYRRSPLASP